MNEAEQIVQELIESDAEDLGTWKDLVPEPQAVQDLAKLRKYRPYIHHNYDHYYAPFIVPVWTPTGRLAKSKCWHGWYRMEGFTYANPPTWEQEVEAVGKLFPNRLPGFHPSRLQRLVRQGYRIGKPYDPYRERFYESIDEALNPELCARCKGKCCLFYPGITSPEDWGAPDQDVMRERIVQAINSGKYEFDSWYGDPTGGDGDEDVWMVRPASQRQPLTGNIDIHGYERCKMLGKAGCELEYPQRPRQCRELDPKEGGKCQDAYSKKAAAIDWMPYQPMLRQLIHGTYESSEDFDAKDLTPLSAQEIELAAATEVADRLHQAGLKFSVKGDLATRAAAWPDLFNLVTLGKDAQFVLDQRLKNATTGQDYVRFWTVIPYVPDYGDYYTTWQWHLQDVVGKDHKLWLHNRGLVEINIDVGESTQREMVERLIVAIQEAKPIDRERLEKVYNKLYAQAADVLKKRPPCGIDPSTGQVSCHASREGLYPDPVTAAKYGGEVDMNTLCCKGCQHWSPQGCAAEKPLACKTWLCPNAASKHPGVAKRLRDLQSRAMKSRLYDPRGDKTSALARALDAWRWKKQQPDYVFQRELDQPGEEFDDQEKWARAVEMFGEPPDDPQAYADWEDKVYDWWYYGLGECQVVGNVGRVIMEAAPGEPDYEAVARYAHAWFKKNARNFDDWPYEIGFALYWSPQGKVVPGTLVQGEAAEVQWPEQPELGIEIGSIHSHTGCSAELSDFDMAEGQKAANKSGQFYAMFVIGPNDEGEGVTMVEEVFDPENVNESVDDECDWKELVPDHLGHIKFMCPFTLVQREGQPLVKHYFSDEVGDWIEDFNQATIYQIGDYAKNGVIDLNDCPMGTEAIINVSPDGQFLQEIPLDGACGWKIVDSYVPESADPDEDFDIKDVTGAPLAYKVTYIVRKGRQYRQCAITLTASTEEEALSRFQTFDWPDARSRRPIMVTPVYSFQEAVDGDDVDMKEITPDPRIFTLHWHGFDGQWYHTKPLPSLERAIKLAFEWSLFTIKGDEAYIEEQHPEDPYNFIARHHLNDNYEVSNEEEGSSGRWFGVGEEPPLEESDEDFDMKELTPESVRPVGFQLTFDFGAGEDGYSIQVFVPLEEFAPRFQTRDQIAAQWDEDMSQIEDTVIEYARRTRTDIDRDDWDFMVGVSLLPAEERQRGHMFLVQDNGDDPVVRCSVCGHQGSLDNDFSYLKAGFNGIQPGDVDDLDMQECGACGAILNWEEVAGSLNESDEDFDPKELTTPEDILPIFQFTFEDDTREHGPRIEQVKVPWEVLKRHAGSWDVLNKKDANYMPLDDPCDYALPYVRKLHPDWPWGQLNDIRIVNKIGESEDEDFDAKELDVPVVNPDLIVDEMKANGWPYVGCVLSHPAEHVWMLEWNSPLELTHDMPEDEYDREADRAEAAGMAAVRKFYPQAENFEFYAPFSDGDFGLYFHIPGEYRYTRTGYANEAVETAIATAVRYKGKVFIGRAHYDAFQKLLAAGLVPGASELIEFEELPKEVQSAFAKESEWGYFTDAGRFVPGSMGTGIGSPVKEAVEKPKRETRTYKITSRPDHLDQIEHLLHWINTTRGGHSGSAMLGIDGDGAARVEVEKEGGDLAKPDEEIKSRCDGKAEFEVYLESEEDFDTKEVSDVQLPAVPAHILSDATDAHGIQERVDFNAVGWLLQANIDQIRALAHCGWSRDYPADDVARELAAENQELANFLDTVLGGFEVYVDQRAAEAFLKQFRSDVYDQLRAEHEILESNTRGLPPPVEAEVREIHALLQQSADALRALDDRASLDERDDAVESLGQCAERLDNLDLNYAIQDFPALDWVLDAIRGAKNDLLDLLNTEDWAKAEDADVVQRVADVMADLLK